MQLGWLSAAGARNAACTWDNKCCCRHSRAPACRSDPWEAHIDDCGSILKRRAARQGRWVVPPGSCEANETRAAHFEDIVLLPTLLAASGGRPGTFVELGAFDGLTSSNSIMLERCHGWVRSKSRALAAAARPCLNRARSWALAAPACRD